MLYSTYIALVTPYEVTLLSNNSNDQHCIFDSNDPHYNIGNMETLKASSAVLECSSVIRTQPTVDLLTVLWGQIDTGAKVSCSNLLHISQNYSKYANQFWCLVQLN